MEKRNYYVVEGPTIDRIFDALKYTSQWDARIGLKFRIERDVGEDDSPVRITNIVLTGIICQDTDFKDPTYIIFGNCFADLKNNESPYDMSPYQFEIHYNAKTLQGVVDFH